MWRNTLGHLHAVFWEVTGRNQGLKGKRGLVQQFSPFLVGTFVVIADLNSNVQLGNLLIKSCSALVAADLWVTQDCVKKQGS